MIKIGDEKIDEIWKQHLHRDSRAHAIEAEVLRLNGGGGEAVAWRTEAAKWLRRKADDQQRTNEMYPAHVKAYPSWEQRVLWLTWLAQDLEAEQEAAPHGLEPWQVDAQPQQAEPGAVLEGWQLVPVVPTESMLVEGNAAGDDHATMHFHEGGFSGGVDEIWAAMLSAAPKDQP